MDAKTYCKKTAAFAGWIIQNIPADLDEETMDGWMNNPDGTKEFLSGLKPPKTLTKKSTSLLSVVATTDLRTVTGKKTEKCFTGSRWAYRDSDFDNCLPANQTNADPCAIATLAPAKDWTFAEGAAAVLGIGAGTDIVLIGNLLIENGHTMTLVQAEEMVEKTERGEKTGMRTDGWGNWFFVETGDPKNPVSVANVNRVDSRWDASVDRLDYVNRWYADDRFLVRNLKDA